MGIQNISVMGIRSLDDIESTELSLWWQGLPVGVNGFIVAS